MRLTIDGSFRIDEEYEEEAIELVERLEGLEDKSDKKSCMPAYISPSPKSWRESNNP